MNYYCEIYDKTIKNESKTYHLKILTHFQYEKCLQINYTNKNPDSFDKQKNIQRLDD